MISDNEYDRLKWRNLPGDNAGLFRAIAGCRIIDAETVDFPAPDEIILYLQNDSGKRYALRAGVDPADRAARFYIQIAELPA